MCVCERESEYVYVRVYVMLQVSVTVFVCVCVLLIINNLIYPSINNSINHCHYLIALSFSYNGNDHDSGYGFPVIRFD